MPLASQDALRRTHLEQRLEFSLSETTHLVLRFSYPEHGYILKPVRSMRSASASLSLRLFERWVQTTGIIGKEEGFGFHTKFPFIILSN